MDSMDWEYRKDRMSKAFLYFTMSGVSAGRLVARDRNHIII